MTRKTIMKIMMKNIRYIFVLTLALLTWNNAWGGQSKTYGFTAYLAKSTADAGDCPNAGEGKIYMKNEYTTTANKQLSESVFGTANINYSEITYDTNSQPYCKTMVYALPNPGFRFLGFGGFDITSGSASKNSGTTGNGNRCPDHGIGNAVTYNGITYYYYQLTSTLKAQEVKTGYTKNAACPYFCWATFGCPQVKSVTHNLDALDISITDPAGYSFSNKEVSFYVIETYEKADFKFEKLGDYTNDFTISEYSHPINTTALQKSGTRKGDAKVTVSLNTKDRHGNQQVILKLTSNYTGKASEPTSQSLTINLRVDLTPTFTLLNNDLNFGDVSIGNSRTMPLSDITSDLSMSAQSATKCEWSIVGGTAFSVESDEIKFSPTLTGPIVEKVKLRATYTDAYGTAVSHDVDITLRGTGAAGADPITITPEGGALPVTEYAVPDLLGTNQGSYVFDVANATSPVVSFSGEGASAFSYSYDAGTKKLTVNVQSASEPQTETPYSVTMTVTGGGSPASVAFTGRFMPKAVNNLAFIDPLIVYTNTTGLNPVTGGNDNPISITLSRTDFLTTNGTTLSGKAVSSAATHVIVTQPASTTMQGATIETDVNVVRRTPLTTLSPGQVVYPHQSYVNFVTTDNTDAPTGFTASLTSGDASLDGSTLNTNEVGELTLHVSQEATANYEALNVTKTIYVVANPAHVPVTMSQNLFKNSVLQNLDGENRETLLENFVVASHEVRWTGSEWNGSAYTDTKWTSNGRTNQFTLTATGGWVVYHFAGVPDVLKFTLAYRSSSSTGTLHVEESANGTEWTQVGDYTTHNQSVSVSIKPQSRYMKFSYTGTDICSVQDMTLSEGRYVRMASRYYDYMQQNDGMYADQQIPFLAANWGNLTVQSSSSAFTASLSDNVATSGYDQSANGMLTIRHTGVGGAAWIKIMQGEQIVDFVRITALPRFIEAKAGDIIYTDVDLRMNADDVTIASRQRTFEHTFGSDDNPLFDKLYIFGVTRNIDNAMNTESGVLYPSIAAATNVAGSNAKIPCYIYTRNGNHYVWSKTIENMNVSSKQADFKLTDADGQKLYFTGTCDYATVGYTSVDDGVFHVKGASGKRVDIYLERCSISSRSKMQSGKTNGGVATFDSYYTTDLPQGAGGVFVFECTDTYSTGFSPYMHIRDYNYLKSVEGIPHNSGGDWQWGAAIEVKVSNLSSHTNLTLDDLWPVSATESVHTNGQLDFSARSAWSRSINIGSANTVLTFNGGYYRFAPINASATGSSYANFQPVGYSAFGGKTYGIGDEEVGGSVIINDGTFGLTGSIPADNAPKCGQSPYEGNPPHLRFPRNTTVNGGSFLLPLVACGDRTGYPGQTINNRYGDNLVEEAIESTGTTADGVALITMSEAMNQYYFAKGDEVGYGVQSIRAKDDGTVVTMLPASVLGVDDLRGYNNYPWLFSAPAMQGQMNAFVKAQVSMNQNAPSGPKDAIQNFLHIEIDDYTRGQFKNFEPATTAGVSISVNGSDNYSSITNTDDYTIRKAITMMIPIVADHWYTFTAPFDINTVSILEILPEDDLVETADNDLDEALEQQGHAMVDFMAYLVKNVYSGSFTIPMYGTFKFQSKSYTFRQLFDQYKTSVGATIEPLKAFKNDNDWDANYFLYEPSTDGTNRSNYWTLTNGNLDVNWIPALPETVNVSEDPEKPNMQTYVMRRGRTYAMQFPYCPGCDAADPLRGEEWDYWTGKYLVLEGTGPQTIWGSNSLRDNELADFSTANQAAFRGNASFGKTTVTNKNVYYHNEEENEYKDYFVNTSNYVAKPGQGFLLVNQNQPAAGAPARSFVFQAPNTNATVNGATGIPTISASQWRGLNPTGAQATKVLINDQIYILRGNKLYDIHGRDVK